MKNFFKKFWAWLTDKRARNGRLLDYIREGNTLVEAAIREGVPRKSILEAIGASDNPSFIAQAFTELKDKALLKEKDIVAFYAGITPQNSDTRYSALLGMRSVINLDTLEAFSKSDRAVYRLAAPMPYGIEMLEEQFDCSAAYHMSCGNSQERLFWAWGVLERYSSWNISEHPYIEKLLLQAVVVCWHKSEEVLTPYVKEFLQENLTAEEYAATCPRM